MPKRPNLALALGHLTAVWPLRRAATMVERGTFSWLMLWVPSTLTVGVVVLVSATSPCGKDQLSPDRCTPRP